MKRFLPLLTLLTVFNLAFSQTLDQSIWRVYRDDGSFFRYFQFANDNMYQSTNNTSYTSFASYNENSNKIEIIDVTGACNLTDTGFYDYQFKDDSVIFNYVKDSCYYRYETMSLFNWVDITSGLDKKLYEHPKLAIYPNPASEYLFINFGKILSPLPYSISDLNGRLYISGTLMSPETRLEITHLPPGIYILSIDNHAIRRRVMID